MEEKDLTLLLVNNKTVNKKAPKTNRLVFVLDATGIPYGRLSTTAANILSGRITPDFGHHLDLGGIVVIINIEKALFTGNKLVQKNYYSYTQYPGGLKKRNIKEQAKRDIYKIFQHSVRGMLKRKHALMPRLHIFVGDKHNVTGEIVNVNVQYKNSVK